MFFAAGGLAACGHPNNTNDSESRHHEEPSHRHHTLGEPKLAVAHTRCERNGPWMVHVPN